MMGGLGFDVKPSYFQWAFRLPSSDDRLATIAEEYPVAPQESGWGSTMPSELLRDVVRRLDESESDWPPRRSVVACAAVCKAWRAATKEAVRTLEQSGRLTFPASLKQSAPLDSTLQCFIKRDRATSTFSLYLGLTPNLCDRGKFLMIAKKLRHATGTEYMISLDMDISRASSSYVGKIQSNFLGTKFTIYDSEPPPNRAVALLTRAEKRVALKQVSPRVPSRSYNVGQIVYKLNFLSSKGPRRVHCTLNSTLRPLAGPHKLASSVAEQIPKSELLVLKNKAPRWHEQLQCWCLNFHGRVTVASVKNFQLAAAVDPSKQALEVTDNEKVLLQFGKVGKDTFTMDYSHPLSAFQAFAISLSSFDVKLACE